MYYSLSFIFLFFSLLNSCTAKTPVSSFDKKPMEGSKSIEPGAWQLDEYRGLINHKRIAMVVNHTSTIGTRHSVDSLISLGIDIKRIFSPEHGFRGKADAGAHIADAKDPDTGISIVSLYGEKRKPAKQDLEDIDLVVFDIQDVGARFYTYISTLHFVMEACAEQNKPILLLDRPNPNGHYVDGPLREDAYKSFVGMHRVPVVYGMTIGEYAQMINGEGWLENGVTCELTIIKCQNYSHQDMYDLPVAPSPNLPNLRSVLLYPSLCFFEGTPVSIGRGTKTQFQVIGHPDIAGESYHFTPESMFGAIKPKLEGQVCNGIDLTTLTAAEIHAEAKLNLHYILHYYQKLPKEGVFFNKNGWFDKLAGTSRLREQIEAGWSEAKIRSSWQEDLDAFASIRSKYLLYP